MGAVHLEPEFYSAADRVLVGSILQRAVGIGEVVTLAAEVLGWAPQVLMLQEQSQPVALAYPGSGRMAFSPSAMVLSTVLHEIAHMMVGAQHRHDAVFLDAFCELVARYGGDQLAAQLRAATTNVTSRPVVGHYACEMKE